MDRWIAERIRSFDSSGIRKVFDLAATLKDPVNLSIGQPDYDVPEPVRRACVKAIHSSKNGYSPTQGIPELRDRLQHTVDERFGHSDRQVFVSSGTSGGLVLAIWSLVNRDDEVIVFDPYFLMYEPLIQLVEGRPILIDTYPDFKIDLQQVADAITPRTKMILFNCPANPTGVVASREEIEGLAKLAAHHDVVLVSDEIYSQFCYDEAFVSPAKFNDRTVVVEGFSKSHAMTGWRLGFVHGPADVIQAMIKLQQFTFVCAPQPAQWAGVTACDVDTSPLMTDYRHKRDRIVEGLESVYDFTTPSGAFYVFPRAPRENGTEFVSRAIENNLLIIPGKIFSKHDSHFRISYAVDDATIDRGVEILQRMARR